MKKYTPSIKANNQLKEQAVSEIKAVLYRLEKGRYDSDIDRKTIMSVLEELMSDVDTLEHTVGTGDEKVDTLATNISLLAKDLKKMSDQNMVHRVEEVVNELDFYVNLWRDALDGIAHVPEDENIEKAKVSFCRRRLNARLSELAQVKENFAENAKRLEKEIIGYEKDLAELDNMMLSEDNERKINDLFRKISALKSKTEALVARKNNYAFCFDLLDMIYVNAAEIVEASDLAGEEIGKAKVLLNLNKLKKVLSDPDKALLILKRMQADIKDVCERTKNIEEKISSVGFASATVSDDALAYKEELLRKKT